jgi:predicted XRE-type DNA-binding protein
MNDEKIEIVRGTGNVFKDMGYVDADARQMKAFLAAEIIGILNQQKLTARAAAEVTGITAADVSNIRNAHLGKFTIDRLVRVLNHLGRKVTVSVEKARDEDVAA